MKTIIITGSTDGIGKHLAKKLATEGHHLIIHGRNPQKLAATLSEIKALSPQGTVSAYRADFSKMNEVYDFANKIKADFDKIDVLFNNAGLYAGSERTATTENIELTFMLSVEVPYILSKELRPLLENASEGRIINTSSYMHHFANIKGLDFGLEKKYSPGLAYNNAKLYTIWLTRYLARQFQQEGSKVTINAYHPGLISTNLGMDSSDKKVQKSLFGRFMKAMSKDVDQGIETGYYLVLSENVTSITGAYFDGKKLKRVSNKGYNEDKVKKLINYCDQVIAVYRKGLL
ncbi:hypothetical protein TP70_04025 [Staphylococcus microti]|uniref:Short chain dehydrogenase n=1 Tax=Staphylococcus microti TaxID=569857 RepID=A0A0D6XSB0_9STAP|nr:SDR family NAD(P)-dependent oxidoreductase [Staphylococcus microti]KIX91121.1 hypothetical protein TP70_04025 [Staphylococcus microti]PNZ79772.1 SDR family oxidoreductase [Staphylococcus microti]SUM58208.1 short chain dehydrogenase [Staphylococcus microti]